jgi:hypothetical protein
MRSHASAAHLQHQRLAPGDVPLLAELPHADTKLRHAASAEAGAAALELVHDGVEL